jgi:hypothetical protein
VFDYRESGLMVEFKRRPSKIPVDSIVTRNIQKDINADKEKPGYYNFNNGR